MALDEAARVRLSARPETSPAALHELAGDPSATVRATLAMNPALPAETNAVLARDPDERVRALLARKLGALAPTLSAEARTRLQQDTLKTLTALARDEAERVRAAIADVVKDMPDAPREIILCLARDQAVTVSEPVIRFSPLLTNEDLLALVAGSAVAHLAIARRREIGMDVSDALIARGTDEVIQALLTNGSAHIREAALDLLAERSVTVPEWHGPLVNRPALPPAAVRTLSRIVADHWLETLAARGDVPPQLASELRARLNERLHRGATTETAMDSPSAPLEADLMAAIREGDAPKAAAMLARAAGTPLAVVHRAATLRSAKALISLAWKAGFSMKAGYALQMLLARLSPGAALKAGPGNSFPLSVQEMRWQIDFLTSAQR
jgi:uncharacterized protein (DUF2336 family)